MSKGDLLPCLDCGVPEQPERPTLLRKKMGAVKGFCLDYASSCDPLEPATDCVGCCGMIFGT